MPDVLTQFSTVSIDAISQFIARKVFTLAERSLVLGRYATRYDLPQRMGTTLRVIRVSRLNLPTTPLTEGVAPDAVALALTNVDVTVQQWGIVVLLTDVAEITTTHPMLRAAIDRTGLAMSEMFEREMAEVIITGTNVTFGSAATTRAGLQNNSNLTTANVIAAVAAMRGRGAVPIVGPLYGGTMSPQVEADVVTQTSQTVASFFSAVAQAGDIERLDAARIGRWAGVEWVRSNFLPILRSEAQVITNGNAPDATTPSFDANGAGSWTGATVVFTCVHRLVTTDQESRINLVSGNLDLSTTTRLRVRTPTATSYVYDLYGTHDESTTVANLRLMLARVAASTTVFISSAPASGNDSAPAVVGNAAGHEMFVSWIFGKDAFGRVELNGMSLRAYLTPPGASYSNPLAQGRKIGAKVMWRSFIIDGAFMQRLESNSSISAALPTA